MLGALAGVYLALTKKYLYSACIGLLAASISFIGQFLTYYCSACTLAASLFLCGGLIGLVLIANKHTVLMLVLSNIVLFSLLLFTLNLNQPDTRNPVIQTDRVQILSGEVDDSIPRLYISVTCPGCREAAREYVKYDVEGQSWQPVIVPHKSLHQGEKMLREAGYKGKVISSAYAPTNIIPVLETKEQVLTGEQIYAFLKEAPKN
jgi:hypothetical protein